MPVSLAPPGAVVLLNEQIPHTLSYVFQTPGGLTPAGIAAVTSAANTYLTAAKRALLGQEQFKYGGSLTVPAAIIGATNGSYPVLNVDAIAQRDALITLIGTAGNAG